MEILMRGRAPLDYSEESAHTVEVTREENERGELGSFGFTLLYEKPPIVGTVVPGGPAERAGLKKNDVVISVNGRSVTHCSHKEVVGIIYHTLTPGVWLTVCEPSRKSSLAYEGGGGRRGLGNFSMSQSTPVLPRYTMEPRRNAYKDGPPPRYSEVERFHRKGSGDLLGNRAMVASVASISGNTRMSPLKQVLTQSLQNGHSSHSSSGQDLYGSSRSPQGSSPTPISGAFTSTSVLVQYIGPVELPESWGSRGISSKCIQECTRRLLSQRHDFFEVFLEITVMGMKVMNVARNVLFKHKRDELYYCGVCTDDEQYFAIVTRKLDQKVHKKEVIYSDGKVQHANICHVFKVVPGKSVLVLHSTDFTTKNKSKQADVKTKTIPVISCATIIDAWKGLFTGEGGGKLSVDSPTSGLTHSLRVGPSTSSFYSTGSSGSNDSNENVYGPSPEKSPQHSKKKRNEVVDLRPEAFSPGSNSALRSYSSPSTGNHYLSVDPTYVRTYQNREYSQLMSTPAFNHTGSGGHSWYSVDSPRDVVHSRSGSWDKGRSPSGSYGERYDRYGVVGGGRADVKKPGFQYDRVQKISDDESPSSLSSSRTPSPTKSLSFHSRSSYASRSHSPSPVSYSSGSRSRSQSPVKQRSPSPGPTGRPARYDTPSVSKLSAGLALEMPMWRSGAMSPCPSSIVSSVKGSRVNLRRQGSESSVMGMGLQDYPYNQQTPHRGLPLKHTPLTASTGSVTTLTTVADEERADGEVEELGRVAGWVASFDKLLADPLGVQCLLHLLEKEHCEENILFWRDAEEFKQKAPQMKNLQVAVKKLYDEYISPTAPRCINVDDRIQKAVESKLSNPPLNIFHEAQEHIYQLMKMDCYPRFKRSDLAKQCILAEVEGRPLPFEAPPENKPSHDWKKQKESGRGRSLFARWSRARLKDMQQPQPLGSSWETPPESKKGRKESKAGTKKEESPLSKKAPGAKGKTSDSKEGSIPDEFLPEDHLNVLQAHKGNIFELNLPNKVTKIMEVPTRGNVQKVIEPVLKKHGYSLDIIELRFANTFKLVDLKASASILIGQHVIVTRSKNTFVAVFPDVPEKILPADGTKSVGLLFNNVLRGVGKSQNFAIYMEGSRVPLELSVDTSVLVGQRVVVKYLPGAAPKPTESAGSSPGVSSKNSKSSLNGSPASSRDGSRTEMDDLFSMIERLTTDTLDDQRTSPTPNTTPEPGQHRETEANVSHPKSQSSSDSDLNKRQQQKHQHRSPLKKTSPPSAELEHKTTSHTSKRRSSTHAKKRMSASKSSEQLLEKEHEGERRGGKGELLPPTHPALSRSKFGRTQSGVVISNTMSTTAEQRSFSPPANLNSNVGNSLDMRDRSLSSPPPPLSRPPPLPSNYANQQQRRVHLRKMSSPAGITHQRLSAGSFNSTGSEDSITTEYNSNPTTSGQQSQEHLYVNRDNRSVSVGSMDVPNFFPNAFPTMERGQHTRLGYTISNPGPIYVNSSVQDKTKSKSMPHHQSQTMNSSNGSREEYHQRLDNFVSQAYSNAPSTGSSGHSRQLSAPGRQLEAGTATHPLQKSVRGTGTAFSSYPWHNAYPQRKTSSSQQARTAAARKELTENQELIKAGEKLLQREINDHHRQSSEGGTREPYKTPLSPTTHTLILPDDDNSLNHQRETFV